MISVPEDCFFFISANIADPDEILPYVAFHVCLYCLPNSMFAKVPRMKTVKYFINLNQLFSVIELRCHRNKLKCAKQIVL